MWKGGKLMNERYRCRLDSYTDRNSAMISVRRHGIYFNSHTTILANLHNFKSITVDRDHENFDWCSKIYIKGSNERASTEYLAFTNDSRRKQNGRGPLYVPMKRIINQFSSLRY